ncbi:MULTISPECIES: hypothetical protein [unclassified Rhodococcus (in: high G+C Gram-positive bacteria)]|uniref:hypothetical protein n=1 Tax=unclassified Rhodococcus (in: high G+C Gram-positive bacteria) TaxID=192944 RepID=UPI001F0D7A3D|nr:hypothetical protein [Rhodococcus sp. 105337]
MDTVESEAVTPIETSKKDRRDLWASITVFALVAVVVVVNYLVGLLDDLKSGTVTARISFDDVPPPTMFSPNGTEVSVASTTDIVLRTDTVSPVAVGFLRSADALETIGYLMVLGLLTWVMVRFLRGRLFDRGAVRGVWAASMAAIVTIIAPTFPRVLGSNLVIRDLAWQVDLDYAQLGPEWWYGYVFCMALSAVAVALRIGSRMARDNEGLV